MSEATRYIVFVCTGNTCRSPLAQALCEKLLSERLGCGREELPAKGYVVQSAGLAAFPGCEASAEAVNIAHELGARLDGHYSKPLTMEVLTKATHIFAMTHSHLEVLHMICGDVGAAPRLLAASGENIADPVGCDAAVYRECALQILSHLEKIVPELLPARSA